MQITTFEFPIELVNTISKVLPLVYYPNSQLMTPIAEIDSLNDSVIQHAADMVATMIANNGVGLASNQTVCDKPMRIATFNFSSPERTNILAIFNPTIISSSNPQKFSEGCLSFPDIFQELTRDHRVIVKGFDYKWQECELELRGIPAVCIQHEIDHLNGKTFIDDLSFLKKAMLKKKLKNNAK
jgi:peptide deformylase